MDLTCVAAILVLVLNVNLNVVLAFPQQPSIKEANGPSTSIQGTQNGNSKIPYEGKGSSASATPSAFIAAAQSQGLKANVQQSVPNYGYSVVLQEQKVPSVMMRNRRSYDPARSFTGIPSTAEELASFLLSKEFSKGQNSQMDSFYRIISLLNAKPAPVIDYMDGDFSEEDEAPIDLLNGRRPHSLPVVPHSSKGKDSYLDDIPMVSIHGHANHKIGHNLSGMDKKHDTVQNSGRLYSLGQLLQNSQNFDPRVPVYRRPII